MPTDLAPRRRRPAPGRSTGARRMSADDPAAASWQRLAALTPARIALGRAGSGLPTREVLRFGSPMPRPATRCTRPSTWTVFCPAFGPRLRDPGGIFGGAGPGDLPAPARSRGAARRGIRGRTGRGRRRSGRPRARGGGRALGPRRHEGAVPLLAAVRPALERSGWRVAPVVVATQGRVALGDAVGALLKARAVALLIGERPGLSSPDSLGIYLTFDPRPGRTMPSATACRTCGRQGSSRSSRRSSCTG